MKKRLLSCLLSLCLAIGMISALGFSASATEADAVATVTSGNDVVTVLTFADAISAAVSKTNSTVQLLADTQTDGIEIAGDCSIDLNGKTLTVTDALTVSKGLVTILDTSNGKTGRIVADKTAAIALKGGSVLLTAGNIHSAGTFALQNYGTGEIFLSGAPSITSDAGTPLYVGNANTLNGSDGAKNAYTGAQIAVSYGCKLEQDTVLAKNATAAQFTAQSVDEDRYLIEEKEGNLVVSVIFPYTWIIVIALAAIALILVIVTIVRTVKYKQAMKFYSVSFPTLMATLAIITQTQLYALIAAGAVCAIALIVCLISSSVQGKKLKAAKALRDAEAKIAEAEASATEEAPSEEVTEAVAVEEVAEEAIAEETVEAAAEEAVVEETVEAVAEETAAEETVEAAAEETAAEETVEAVAEETAAEETVEAVAEEAVVEETVEEVAEEAPLTAEPPQAKPDRVVIAETDANGNVIYSAYKKSFTARVIQSPVEVQERYETLKNALLSYKKVNSRVSWSYDSIKSGRKQLAKFAIRGKSLCLFLALDMSTLEGTKYNVDNAGDSKKYADVPCRLRLSSKRSIKWGLELIEKLAEQEQLVPNPKFTPKKWCMENETTESLIEKGLIKKIV